MKTKLIDELKEDHKHISNYLAEIKKPYSEVKKDTSGFFKLKNLLLEHLKKENIQLYPELLKHTETNMVARTFSHGMEAIAKEVLDFFNIVEKDFNKSKPSLSGFEYAKSLGRITGLLKNRISNEEKVLYAEFENL